MSARSIIHRAGLAALAAVFSLPPQLAGQSKDLTSLLPPDGLVEPWTKIDEPLVYEGDDLFMLIDGGAELYHQYGFVQVISQEYVHGDDSIVCNIYQMKDPETAFGIFSYGRSPDRSPVTVGDGGFGGSLQLAFWQDRYYVTVESFTPGEKIEKARVLFGHRISERIGHHADPPALLRRLPQNGLIGGSEKLLKGRLTVDNFLLLGTADPFQLSGEDRVLYGEYRVAQGKAKLFYVVYGEGQRAGRLYSQVKQAFAPEKGYRFLGEQGGESHWSKDGRFYLLRQGADNLALVVDAPSIAEAAKIIGQD